MTTLINSYNFSLLQHFIDGRCVREEVLAHPGSTFAAQQDKLEEQVFPVILDKFFLYPLLLLTELSADSYVYPLLSLSKLSTENPFCILCSYWLICRDKIRCILCYYQLSYLQKVLIVSFALISRVVCRNFFVSFDLIGG